MADELKDEILDFSYKRNMTVKEIASQYYNLGYQATELGKVIKVIRNMKKAKAKIYFTFTSNMVSGGLRGLFAEFIKRGFADVIVTTVGSIEEDIIKALKSKFYVGSFQADDVKLGKKGINRIGNIFVGNDDYMAFEDFMSPVLKKLYEKKKVYTPSEFIYELSTYITDENSIIYQARKKGVKIYCPALTDGAMGMQIYFFRQKHSDFVIDIAGDFKNIIDQTLLYDKTAGIILGGGVSKHHAIISNLMRDGLDFLVYMTTAMPFSGSLSGATTSEAKSWGKLKGEGKEAMVYGDVSLTFPLVAVSLFDEFYDEA